MLYKLQKWVCRTVGSSLAASLEPLTHLLIVVLKVFSIGITLLVIHLNRLNWFHFLVLVGSPLIILIGCMIFLLPFLDVIGMSL